MKDQNEPPGSEQDLSEIARDRPKLEVDDLEEYARSLSERHEPSTASKILRGCGIAFGIAVLLVMFVFGACMMAWR